MIAQTTEKEIVFMFNSIEEDLKTGIMPDLYGLNLKDALYLLERYVKVMVTGSGGIVNQSIKRGEHFINGSVIRLELA
jgi:hypothetical protein